MQLSRNDRYLMAKQALFERAYYKLNPKQQEAVFHVNGPLLVLAGAGSGKTTVLVQRVAFLIRYGNAYFSERVPADLTDGRVEELERAAAAFHPDELAPILAEFADDPCPPWQVLAITFTNKAANEMKTRLSGMFPENPACAAEITSGTFHSLCARILRQYGELVGYRPGFSIYDTDDSKKACIEAIRRAGADEKMFPVKAVMHAVSRAKDRLLTPEELDAEAGNDYRMRQIARIYNQYQQILRESNALDFDDLIMQTVLLLRTREEVRRRYQKRFRYVCVDEYQDTNPAQFALTGLLSGGTDNLMVVGDDDQSIYKFRGATVENILSFDHHYKNASIIRLEQNYRSTQNILDAANAVISHNVGRLGKELWTAGGTGEPVFVTECEDQNDENRRIIDTVRRKVARSEAQYRDFAVLYRMNAQSQTLEKAFARAAIPYRMLGGVRFGDRKEIRDATAYLQLIDNHNDNVRLLRIINEPKRKIGSKTMEAIALIAEEQNCSQFEVIERADEFTALKNACPMLRDFAALIHTLTEDAETMPIDVLLDRVLDLSGYRQMLVNAGEEEKERLENLEEFKSQMIEYIRESEDPTLRGFLEEAALVADVDRYDETADAVVMMTVHSAKGLEFPVVFLPGMEDGIFPGMQTVEQGGEEIEEERRLAYVAYTRAKKELHIFHSRNRLLFGRTVCNPVSRFVTEIPEKLIRREKAESRSGWQSLSGGYGYGNSRRYGNSGYGYSGGDGGYSGNSAYGYRENRPDSVYGSRGASPSPSRPRTYYSERAEGPASPVCQKPARPAELLAPGNRVRHSKFGDGEILSVKPVASDAIYEVMFDTSGTRKLMASSANLTKI